MYSYKNDMRARVIGLRTVSLQATCTIMGEAESRSNGLRVKGEGRGDVGSTARYR